MKTGKVIAFAAAAAILAAVGTGCGKKQQTPTVEQLGSAAKQDAQSLTKTAETKAKEAEKTAAKTTDEKTKEASKTLDSLAK